MANFYAQLKQIIKEFDILYMEAPSYLKHFACSDNNNASNVERIVLFCNRVPKLPKTFKIKTENEDHENDFLNLTGSPLKDSCNFDTFNESLNEVVEPNNAWDKSEEDYEPIKASQAQYYFSHIAATYDKQFTTKCWALCESENEPILAQSVDLKKGRFHQGVLKFTGFVPYEPIGMNALYAKHALYVPMQYGLIESTVDSYYKLRTETSNSQITVQVSQTMVGPVEQPTIESPSKIILHQSVKINNFSSLIQTFWLQICIIDMIKETVVNYKASNDSSSLVFNTGSSGELTEIKEEILKLLTEPAAIHKPIADEDDQKKIDFKNIDKIIDDADARQSSELTDQLWTVLKGCSSFEMLKEAIEYVLNSAAKINVVNMPTSKSRLSYLIREVSEHRIAIPKLNGSEPLELLIEIGIEKVGKDYEFIFSESKLCSGEELRSDKRMYLENMNNQLNVRKSLKSDAATNGVGLNTVARKTLMHSMKEQNGIETKNVGFQNSMFSLENVEDHLARLGRIHMILEHLILIQSHLKLENVYTTFLEDLRKPLIPFYMLKEMKLDTREIPVTNQKILNIIENDLPDRQRAVLQSRNRFKLFRNTFLFSLEPILPPNVFKAIEIQDSKEKKYYSHQYLEIEWI